MSASRERAIGWTAHVRTVSALPPKADIELNARGLDRWSAFRVNRHKGMAPSRLARKTAFPCQYAIYRPSRQQPLCSIPHQLGLRQPFPNCRTDFLGRLCISSPANLSWPNLAVDLYQFNGRNPFIALPDAVDVANAFGHLAII